jgi:hypothetical protein
MEAAFAVVVGIGAVAVSPFIPGLRPLARKVVAGGLAVADAATGAAAVAGEHWKDLVAEVQAEREAAAEAKEAKAESRAEAAAAKAEAAATKAEAAAAKTDSVAAAKADSVAGS